MSHPHPDQDLRTALDNVLRPAFTYYPGSVEDLIDACMEACRAAPPRPDHAGGVERCGYTECAALGRTTCEDCRDLTPDQAPDKAAEREGVEHIQHVKSGGWYEVVTRDAQVQTDTPLADYAFVAVYRNVITGATWVRPLSEMDDGRFKPAPAALAPKPTGTEAGRGGGKSVGERISSPHYVDAVGSILIGVIGSAAAKHGGKITADGLIGPQEFWDALHPQLNAEIETYMARAMDEDRRRAATPTPPVSPTPDSTGPAGDTVRHVKTGGLYDVVGEGRMQTSDWEREVRTEKDEQGLRSWAYQSVDMERVTVYRSQADGSLWVRPTDEFCDGRFVGGVGGIPSAPIAAPVREDGATVESMCRAFVGPAWGCGNFMGADYYRSRMRDVLASLHTPASDVPGEAQTQEGWR